MILISHIKNDCLNKTILTEFGFTDPKDTAEKLENASVCSRVFKLYGSCVKESEAKIFI